MGKSKDIYFSWAGKDNLYNIIQSPISGILKPDIKKSVDFDKTENMVIVGDNLDVMKILLESYSGKIKMIYIDPPYNTGKNFVYRDRFKSHSDWLNFMYPRLYLARNLLRDDGVIFVSIDDNEVHHLRMIMDEIFGEENFVITITVNRPSEIASDNVVSKSEYIIVYAKNIQDFKVDGVEKYTISRGTVGNPKQTMPIIEFPIGIKCYNLQDGIYKETRKVSGSRENVENLDPIIIENGKLAKPVRLKARWRSSNDMREFFKNNFRPTLAKISGIIEEIYFENDRFIPQIKKRTYKKISSLLLSNKKGSEDLKKLGLYESIEFPKSIALLKEIISYFKFNDANLILDFFAGSGTTGHAVWDLNKEDGGNRKFILVQLDEEVQDEEIKKEFPTVADICIERLRRVSDRYKREEEGLLIKSNLDLGFKVFRLDKSGFNQTNGGDYGKKKEDC